MKPTLQIIVASTRPGRVGLPVAEWFLEAAQRHDGFEAELIDLAEWNLPLMDEPNHPRLRQYVNPHTFQWSEKIERGDAFVFVTAEYNHSFTAPLKNAIDYLHQERQYKAVGLVSYGGISAGTRAAEMLKPVVLSVRMLPVFETVAIPFPAQLLKNGRFEANDSYERAAMGMLDEIQRVEAGSRSLRKPAGS